MKVKTSDLIGRALDYAVALAEGGTELWYDTVAIWWIKINGEDHALSPGWGSRSFTPSTDWRQGGRIIDCERICVNAYLDPVEGWNACVYIGRARRYHLNGSTPLIAAMRCYVASKLGDEIEVPDQLGKT